MKQRSCVIFPLLVTAIFIVSLMIPGLTLAAPTQATSVTVWFNGSPQLTILYPTFYELSVAAKTSSGLWITYLHWNFGDGSTLDSVYSAQGYVSEVRYHQYSQPGVYTVTVTAYDNMGNSGTAQISVTWAL